MDRRRPHRAVGNRSSAADNESSLDEGTRNAHEDIASGMYHTEIMKELLIADLEMFGAAEDGNLESLQHFLQLGVPIDTHDTRYDDTTPLHIAARSDQLEVVEFLIRNNCDINPKDRRNCTPLYHALLTDIRGETEEIVNLLVRSGADIDCCPKNHTPHYNLLIYACQHNWKDTVEYILQNDKVNVEYKDDEDGMTPLMFATMHSDCDIARLLLQAGANVKARDDWGNTAFHFACHYKNVEFVVMLLSTGADVNIQGYDNQTPLHWAVDQAEPSLDIIKLLIEHDAYFTNYDDDKLSRNTPLKSQVLKDVDLCTRLIINKFNHQSLPAVYKNPEYAKRLPKIDKLCIGKGVKSGIEGFVESEIEKHTYCNVIKVRPTVLTLMCVEALISPQPTKKKRSADVQITGTVKRLAR